LNKSPNPAPPIYEILEVHFKVDDVMHTVTVVNQNHVSANKDVTVAARRRRQSPIVIGRNRVDHSAHVPIENISLAKPGFILGS